MATNTELINQIAEALATIRRRIDQAARVAHRDPGSVELVAASKLQDIDRLRAAIAAGQRVFGENRVQEAAAKWPELRSAYPDLVLHLIGPLQTNKAKQAVGLFDVIESLDRESLAVELAKLAAQGHPRPDCYIQVNTGEEPQKAGIPPHEADAFIERCRDIHGLKIIGLMCVPPADDDPAPHFALLGEMAKRHGLAKLSMGMSGDFEVAVRFGATSVRVGSAIFGARPPV